MHYGNAYKRIPQCTSACEGIPQCTAAYEGIPQFTAAYEGTLQCTAAYESSVTAELHSKKEKRHNKVLRVFHEPLMNLTYF